MGIAALHQRSAGRSTKVETGERCRSVRGDWELGTAVTFAGGEVDREFEIGYKGRVRAGTSTKHRQKKLNHTDVRPREWGNRPLES